MVHAPLRVDGRDFLVALQLDWSEHRRRRMLGINALTSTGLLHALWELPYGIGISRDGLSALDCETLDRADSGWVEGSVEGFVRWYQPAGMVRSISVTSRSLSRAIQRAATHPPTTERIAVWLKPSNGSGYRIMSTLERARQLGVGVVAATDDSVEELAAPKPAALGLPNVFRWWQAELAYRTWLTRTAPTELAEISA